MTALMRRPRPTHIGGVLAAGLIFFGISQPPVEAAATASEPTLEEHFAGRYPAEVLASYPPRLRAILLERMHAERRRAGMQRMDSLILGGVETLRPYVEATRDAVESLQTPTPR